MKGDPSSIHAAEPWSLTVAGMEDPCCFGLMQIARHDLEAGESAIPLEDITVGIQGEALASPRGTFLPK